MVNPIEPASAGAATQNQAAGQLGGRTATAGDQPARDENANRDESFRLAANNAVLQEKAAKSDKKPNILILWDDDIGISNISAYSDGLMATTGE
ncbi:MAG TPA: hypothetical protein VGM05_02690 [Planctomycetaceae bacterium]|jgi:hypothetical protein